MSNIWTWLLVIGYALALAVSSAAGATKVGAEIQAPHLEIRPGKKLVVKLLKSLGRATKGEFVASDAHGIRLRLKNGEERTIPWCNVREVKLKPDHSGTWWGMAIGAAGFAIASFSDGGGCSDAVRLGTIGFGAAAGALYVRMIDPKEPPLYPSPKHEASTSTATAEAAE